MRPWRPRAAYLAGTVAALLAAACGSCRGRAKAPAAVEVRVQRVVLDPTAHTPVVLLEEKAGDRVLPIWIGAAEAQAIAMQLERVVPPRPMTHDLLKAILERLGVGFEKAVIHSLRENTYFANIVLRSRGRRVVIDSRPSDAIALAVRFEKPIYVAPGLFGRAAEPALQAAAPRAAGAPAERSPRWRPASFEP